MEGIISSPGNLIGIAISLILLGFLIYLIVLYHNPHWNNMSVIKAPMDKLPSDTFTKAMLHGVKVASDNKINNI